QGSPRLRDAAAAQVARVSRMAERRPTGVVTVERDLTVVAANTAARRIFHPEPLRPGWKPPPLWLEPDLATFVARLFQANLGPQRRDARPDAEHAFVIIGVPSGHGSTAL